MNEAGGDDAPSLLDGVVMSVIGLWAGRRDERRGASHDPAPGRSYGTRARLASARTGHPVCRARMNSADGVRALDHSPTLIEIKPNWRISRNSSIACHALQTLFAQWLSVDVRLTAADGYQAQRSYSIASAPEENYLVLTVERLEPSADLTWFPGQTAHRSSPVADSAGEVRDRRLPRAHRNVGAF
jgi:hypothetical protein